MLNNLLIENAVIVLPVIIIVCIIAVLLTILIVYNVQKNNKIDKIFQLRLNKADQLAKEYNLLNATAYRCINTTDYFFIKCYIDTNTRSLLFLSGDTDNENIQVKKFPFDSIIGIKLYTNNENMGGVERAVVGSLIAGSTGAVVGSTTAKKHVSSMFIDLLLSSIEEPLYRITLVKSAIQTSSDEFQTINEFAANLYASVNAITKSNSTKTINE